jgi:probable HAF family extracellular repeat protein
MMTSFKVRYLFIALMLLAPVALAQNSASDDFNRPDGTNMGSDWSEEEGNTVIENNMAKGSSGMWMLGWMYHTGFSGPYADSTTSIEFTANQGSENVFLVAGLNPLTWGGVSAKIQDNDMDGMFDRVFFESAINAGNWGSLGVPVWYDLDTPTLTGKMTLTFKDAGDTAVLEIDNDASGLTETYEATGILGFTYPIDGEHFGVGHYNFPYMDNWSASIDVPAATFTLLPAGTTITDMTADGNMVVGQDMTNGGCFYWTQASGLVNIGGEGNPYCSEDGSQICANITDGGYTQAALWLGGTNWQPLGGIGGTSGSSMSTTYDISGDGTYIVGLGWVSAGTAHAFQWDSINGMVDLGSLGGESSRANAISSDGHVIVGWDQDPSSGWWRSAKWVDGVEELMAPGTYGGAGQGLSSDGTWIVGDNHPDFTDDGWRWSADTGFVSTGTLSGWLFQGHPLDVSDDGQVVVGWSGYFMDQFAMIWTEDTGCVDLKQYLTDLGVTVPVNIIAYAQCVSDDGTTIYGTAGDMFGYNGFIATIPPITPAPLKADSATISAGTASTVDFTLTAGTDHANRQYLLLGGVSGTAPGTPLPGGMATLPLNWDLFTDIVWGFVNTPTFKDFLGTTDADGKAAAQLNAPHLNPASVGIVMNYAYCLGNPFDFASNAVDIEIVP